MSTPESQEQRVAELERQCTELRRALEVVYGSRSWRLTAPLRRAAELRRERGGAAASAPQTHGAAGVADEAPESPGASGVAASAPESQGASLADEAPESPDAAGAGEEPAYPPPALRERVAGTPDLGWFKQAAAMAIEDIEGALALGGQSLADFRHVYDFGCGCGRLTLPLAERLGAPSLTASDSDDEAIAWLRERLPDASVTRNQPLPPLLYADGEFDLIIGWSVFTHLPESYQDAWLEELDRVLAPGGMMLQTVHGPTSFDVSGAAADDPVRNALAGEGFIYHEGDYGADSPFEPHYQTSFHHPTYIRGHWSHWFEVLDVGAGRARPAQDMVVLRSRRG